MKIKLADVVIDIEALHDEVYELCKAYEVGDAERGAGAAQASFNARISQQDIDYEREQTKMSQLGTGSEVQLESLAVYRKIAEGLVEHETILFHGSAIAIDGKGYIIAAPSGTGKSTLARNLANLLGNMMTYVNDDKPLISAREGEIRVYGTPWDGKHHLSNNISVPLAGILVLERSEEPWIKEVSATDVLQELLQQTYRPDDPALLTKTLGILNEVCQGIKCYRIGATLNAASALQFAEMTGAISSIKEELMKTGWIAYRNVGNSMEPLIRQNRDLVVIENRNQVTAKGTERRELHVGDVVLFKREGAKNLVLHRIIRIHNGTYDIIGDNQYGIERGVRDDQILGILTKVIRDADTPNEETVAPDDPRYYTPRTTFKIYIQRIMHHLARS